MEKLIITAAVNGGITNREKNFNVPYSPEEIAQSVVECWNAGAAIAHIHARNPDGSPSYAASTYREIIDRIRDRCDIIINFSTSGLNLPKGLSLKPGTISNSNPKLPRSIAARSITAASRSSILRRCSGR